MKLIRCDNPFDLTRDRIELELYDREHLIEYLAEHQLNTDRYALSLNGELLPPENVHTLALRGDDCIVAIPVLGNNTLKSIAMLGVAAAAIFFAGPLGAALFPALAATSATAATALGYAIISIGGTLLVNGIASLFQKQPGGASYTFDGPQTTSRSGIPIPKGYGLFEASPNIIQSWVDLQHADQDLHDADDGAKDIGRQWLNIIACFGFGPASSLSDIRINGNDITSFQDVAYFIKLGTNTQTPVDSTDPGWTILNQTTTGSAPNTAPTADFNRIVNNYPQSTRIRCDVTPNYTIVPGQRNDTQRLDVTVQFPRGVWRYDDHQVIKRLDIVYNVYYKLRSSSTWILAQHHVYTNIRQAILRQITTIDGLTAGLYDVKVEKIGSGAHDNPIYSVEHESDFFGDELWLESIQETCYDRLAYPNMILLGLRIMASDQIAGANIQLTAKVNYELRSTLPTELAPYAHDNPALVAYDVLTDPLAGGGLSPSNINLPSFTEWADLCDTLVADDLGGTQKLAVFNGVFEEAAKTVWDSFSTIGVMSRAMPTRIGTQVGVMLDQPDTPVQLFNVGNIYKDSYSKEYLAIEDRANEVEVNYANADDDYKTRNPLRAVPEAEQDTGYNIKKSKINLLGCTNTVQAYYWAQHKLLENQLLLRTHKWDSPAQAVVSRVGNIVLLQHDVPKWATGGLIAGGTATSPKLDVDFTFNPELTYTLTILYPKLLRATGTITGISGLVVSVSGYSGADVVKRLVDGTIDKEVTSYGSGTVTVTDVAGLTIGDSVELYDIYVLVSVNVIGIGNPRGNGTAYQFKSRPLEDYEHTVTWSDFVAPDLPGDAVITGIYPVIVAEAVHDEAFDAYSYHTASILLAVFPQPFNPNNLSFSRTLFWDDVTLHSAPAALSELVGSTIGMGVSQSLFIDGMSDFIGAWAVAFAVYYESTTATVDPLIPAPLAVPTGQGVAWAHPASVAASGVGMTGAAFGQAYDPAREEGLILSTPLPADPIPDSPYILATSVSQPKAVRVRGIKRASDLKFTITAIDYDPLVYDIPTPVDLSAVTSGGSAGYSGSTPDTPTVPPPDPPPGVVNPGDPGYGGSSLPSGLGDYTQLPATALSQTSSTALALASVTTTFSDHQATYGPQTFTITDPASTPTWYYITVDPVTLTYFCEVGTSKVGDGVHVYLGAILATHLGGAHSAATPGGWPIPAIAEAVS